MDDNNITPDALSGDTHVIASDANGTVGNDAANAAVAALSLAELNQHLGKNFPTKEAALKSLADTFSYVGKKKEDIEREVLSKVATKDETSDIAKQLSDMRKEMFFKDNPQFAEPNVRALITKLGGNPAEVVNTPEFKSVFEKVQGFDENQKLRTVLDSNPRLASSRDKLTEALELKGKGAHQDTVEATIAAAVLGTIE